MSTFREQVETQTETWAERHRAHGRHVSWKTEQAWAEADACAAAQGYGDLQLVEVFVAYDGPRVLSAQSATGQFFLAGWAAEGPEYDDWMFVPISSARLVMVRSGRITLRDAFIHPESMVYHVQLGHSPESDELVRLISGEDLPESWLPEADFALSIPTPTKPAAVSGEQLRQSLIGSAVLRPYAADPDLKRLRRERRAWAVWDRKRRARRKR